MQKWEEMKGEGGGEREDEEMGRGVGEKGVVLDLIYGPVAWLAIEHQWDFLVK